MSARWSKDWDTVGFFVPDAPAVDAVELSHDDDDGDRHVVDGRQLPISEIGTLTFPVTLLGKSASAEQVLSFAQQCGLDRRTGFGTYHSGAVIVVADGEKIILHWSRPDA